MKVISFSDDRFGRKNGVYEQTQKKITDIFEQNKQLGLDHIAWTFEHLKQTEFYDCHKELLDNPDAAKNGRAYKPFVIFTGLEKLNEGEFLIYTDCSPEMWENIVLDEKYNIEVIKRLCSENNGILTAFVKWDTRNIINGGLGIHTHENFTTNRCIDAMNLRQYERSFMHASGMIVLQKSKHTISFMEEWLYWNTIDECACLGKYDIPNDYSYWDFTEEFTKMGHRHDQSISGLLINKMGNKLIDIHYDTKFHTYNFLNFCRTDIKYKFIDSNFNPDTEVRIKKGQTVINNQGVELKVFEIRQENGIEKYIVGLHRQSCYSTTADLLTVKN